MPMGDPGGHFADTGGYGSFNQGGGGFQTGGALSGGRGEYGLAGDRSFNSGNVGAYSQNMAGNNFGNPIYSNPIPARRRVNPITQQVVNPNPYTAPPMPSNFNYQNWVQGIDGGWNSYPGQYPGGDQPPTPTGTWNTPSNGTYGIPGGTSNFDNYGSWGNANAGASGGMGMAGGADGGYGGGGGWANGGMIRPGQSGWVGERGPEFAQGLPGGGVAITPNHMLGNPPPRPMGPPMTFPPAQQPGMGGGRMSGGGFRGMLGY